MLNIGPLELMVILIVALLVVGPKRLPEVGRSIGRGLREFRKAQDEVQKTLQMTLAEEPTAPKVSVPAPATGEGSEGVDTPTNADAAATEPAAASEAVETARTLGRGLAELRRARDEIQRTFKVDLGDVTATTRPVPPKATPAPSPAPPGPETADQAPPEEPAAAE